MINNYNEKYYPEVEKEQKQDYRTISLAFDYARKNYDNTEVQELFQAKK